MKDQKKRKNIRLSGYDYSLNGVYFVTFCVKNNDPVLSSIPYAVAQSLPDNCADEGNRFKTSRETDLAG